MLSSDTAELPLSEGALQGVRNSRLTWVCTAGVAMLASSILWIAIAIAIDITDRDRDRDRHRHRHEIAYSQLDNQMLDIDLDLLAAAVLQNEILCWTDRELCRAGGLKIEW